MNTSPKTAQDSSIKITLWSDNAIELIAHRFKLLAGASRLRLLFALYDGEKSVSELIEITHMEQTNVSRQLTLLADGGLITRHKTGQQVWCSLADASLIELTGLVCQSLFQRESSQLASLNTNNSTSPTRRV